MTMDDIVSSSSPSSRHEKKDGTAMSARRAKQSVVKYKKAPEAPKNPKTAFFFFSMHMHEEKKKGNSGVLDISKKIPDAAKQISTAWKALSPEEKKKWEEKAEKDKLRYKVEKSIFSGQLTVVKGEKRARKDSEAPKRPMSAFLDFSKTLRSQAIKDNPHVTDNKEISKILGSMWRNATDEEKRLFVEKELLLRDQYNEETRVYKTDKKDQQVAERNSRVAKVMDAIENGTSDQLIQSAEESIRLSKASQENDVTAHERRSNDRVDHSYAAARCQRHIRSEESFADHYQLHNIADRSYGERYYSNEDNIVPLFRCATSYVPQYQNISSRAFPSEYSQGSQRLPDDHRQSYYDTANYSEQRRHHLMEQNTSAHPPHLRGVQNHFLVVPSYNIIRMGGDVSSIWQCPTNATAPNSSQPIIFSPLPNERNIPGGNHRL